ncbi:MAG: sporulation protein YyaC [Paenibacillaceae bacterium]|jgi:putative sporulation protein YyaC|nr:sporulation protein YyaC [Paenibacillaceae bacterium]
MLQQWSGVQAAPAGSGWRKTAGGTKLPELFQRIRELGVKREQLVFLCIGTDRSSGDAFGPLTGTLLQEAGFGLVVGTLAHPCDGDTWGERILELEAMLTPPAGRVVVSVDACLGNAASLGLFLMKAGPLTPGTSLRRGLPPVGDYSIGGIVCENRAHPYTALQTAPLGRVLPMARQVVQAALEIFPAEV